MKKNIRLSETELVDLIRKVIYEQSTIATGTKIIQGPAGDPYEYKREGGKYYTRKKGSTNWILTKDQVANAIATKIFKEKISTATPSVKTPKDSVIDKSLRPDTNVGSDTTREVLRSTTINAESILAQVKRYESIIGKIGPRGFSQLQKIISQKQFATTSFIIVDKNNAVAALFGPNYKFITKAAILTGMSKDTESSGEYTYKEWFQATKDLALKYPDSNAGKKVKDFAIKAKVSVKDLDFNKHVKNKEAGFPWSYNALKVAGLGSTPTGTYKLGPGHRDSGYAGSGLNAFPLVDIETGERLAAALHGAAGKFRGDVIKKAEQDKSSTKEYTRVSYGCVNVPAQFISAVQKANPQYVVILPDSGDLAQLPKVTTFGSWSDKIASLGEKCVRSFYDLFS